MHMEETMRQTSALAPHTNGPTITAGEILVEIMATTVGSGFLEPQTLIGPFPSGAPAIFIDQVARCGGAAGIIAAVGDDDFGRLNVERLRGDGVDVSAIATIPDRPTGSAFSCVAPATGRLMLANWPPLALFQVQTWGGV